MLDEFIFFFVLLFGLPMVPSVLLTLLSVTARRQNKKFQYYNFSFASVCNALFLLWFLFWFFYAPRQRDAQDGLVLLGLPFLAVFFSVGSFVLGFLLSPGLDLRKTDKPLPSFPYWASVASITAYELFWLLHFLTNPGKNL